MCADCGQVVSTTACDCGTTRPSARSAYAWLGLGVALVPVSAAGGYAAWTLAGRTVLERMYLGVASTVTGAAVVGLAAMVALAAPAAVSRGLRAVRERHESTHRVEPTVGSRAVAGLSGVADAVGSALDRLPAATGSALVALGVVLWAGAALAPAAVPRSAFVAGVVLAWAATPVGVALDGRAADAGVVPYLATAVVPFLAAVVGSLHLLRFHASR